MFSYCLHLLKKSQATHGSVYWSRSMNCFASMQNPLFGLNNTIKWQSRHHTIVFTTPKLMELLPNINLNTLSVRTYLLKILKHYIIYTDYANNVIGVIIWHTTEGVLITGHPAGRIDAGGNMVFVKVRETYDLGTKAGKMTTLAIHTPTANLIKKNYPGLLLQCRAYRPVSCDVVCACASVQSADPLQVGTVTGDIAPEDLFNPILYKPMGNFGMSQLEARINHFVNGETGLALNGETVCGRDEVSDLSDEFDLYYGLLADTHKWRHANPQAGFQMRGLRPIVYEMLYSVGDNPVENGTTSAGVAPTLTTSAGFAFPNPDGSPVHSYARAVKGNGKPLPMMNTTIYNAGETMPGFTGVVNAETDVPAPQIIVGAIIVPPSRLHELYFRLVVEWTLEFSMIRQIGEITSWGGLANLGQSTHYKNYDYSESKAVAGVDSSVLTSDDGMVSANVEIKKVM